MPPGPQLARPPRPGPPALVVLARRPVAGQVKSRLARQVGQHAALDLYTAFLADTLTRAGWCAGALGLRLVVAWAGPPGPMLPIPPGALHLRQSAGDLGRRQEEAVSRAAAIGAAPVLLVGADSPTLPERLLAQALTRLRRCQRPADLVVAPALDGGYVLLGLHGPCPGLLQAIPWGTDQVLSRLRARAVRLSLRLECLEPWYDVDDGDGLRRLRCDLRRLGSRAAPRTAAALERLARPGGVLGSEHA